MNDNTVETEKHEIEFVVLTQEEYIQKVFAEELISFLLTHKDEICKRTFDRVEASRKLKFGDDFHSTNCKFHIESPLTELAPGHTFDLAVSLFWDVD